MQASLALRAPGVLAAERARFDELLVDDFQLVSFAGQRLLTQLAGACGRLVVAGNPSAAVASDPLASAAHLHQFARRFGAPTVELRATHRAPERPPELRLLDPGDARTWPLPEGAMVVDRRRAERFVGAEAAIVVVEDATDGRWPSPRPRREWFDLEVLHGPDVPDDAERERRWEALERRRFLVATTRATTATVVVAQAPVTRFLRDVLR